MAYPQGQWKGGEWPDEGVRRDTPSLDQGSTSQVGYQQANLAQKMRGFSTATADLHNALNELEERVIGIAGYFGVLDAEKEPLSGVEGEPHDPAAILHYQSVRIARMTQKLNKVREYLTS